MPPNTEDTKVDDELSRITLEELDLKKLVRERGFYGVHPDVYVSISSRTYTCMNINSRWSTTIIVSTS